MAKHHPDLIMCRKQPGIAIGRLCEKCDGKCVICDSYVRWVFAGRTFPRDCSRATLGRGLGPWVGVGRACCTAVGAAGCRRRRSDVVVFRARALSTVRDLRTEHAMAKECALQHFIFVSDGGVHFARLVCHAGFCAHYSDRPCTMVRICDECNYGSYEGRCVICGGMGISDAFYCKECTVQEKDRDGCPKIVNLGSAKTDLFYERKKYGFKKR